jgi:hypothetical protein
MSAFSVNDLSQRQRRCSIVEHLVLVLVVAEPDVVGRVGEEASDVGQLLQNFETITLVKAIAHMILAGAP